jgi:ribose transport system substrate-binding protein
MNRLFGITLLVCAMTVTSGCRQKDESKGGGGPTTQPVAGSRIALIMKARTNPFFAKMEEGARRAATKLSVDLSVLSIDRETDYEKQAAQVEAAVTQGVRAILIAPADSKGIVAPLRRAQDRGVLIINLDNRIDAGAAQQAGLNVLAFIGPNNAEGAEKATNELIRRMSGKGKVAMLEGIVGADNAKQRQMGFMKALLTHPAVQLAGTASANWDIAQGQQKMEALLGQFSDLAGVFCANDNMALGAIQAIESAGRTGKVLVAAYDNIDAAQKAIRDGKLVATIEQHPDLMGEWGVENAVKALQGEPIAKEIAIPTDLVTAEMLKAKS